MIDRLPTSLSRYWSAERYSNTGRGRRNWWLTYTCLFLGSYFVACLLETAHLRTGNEKSIFEIVSFL